MDEYTADAFANRDEPVPVVSFGNIDDTDGLLEQAAKEEKLQSRLSGRYFKGKFSEKKSELDGKSGSHSGRLSLHDRLLNKLLQQIIPVEDAAAEDDEPSAGRQPLPQSHRPAFSLPVMTNNFRRFNARIGIVFVFQNRVEKLLTWRYPTQTWSFLFLYSFICLNPYLIFISPVIVLLLFVMVPGFLARHPPPPPSASTPSTTSYYSYEGPALAPASTIKPVPETSKDFFRNMRDLQNSMADFANLHDATVAVMGPATNFSNETLSSTLFLVLTILTAILFLCADVLPWRFLFLFGGNALVGAGHPTVEVMIARYKEGLSEKQKQFTTTKEGSDELVLFGIPIPTSPSALMTLLKSLAAISLDTAPEEREVEIFELQHKMSTSPFSGSAEWETFMFTPTPYDPLSPSRIAGDRPRGTRFFEDVRPPKGWAWKGKKWQLDLECREWVMERLVTGVEFEVRGNTGDGVGEEVGGWVWDLPFQPPDPNGQEDPETLAYVDTWQENPSSTPQRKEEGKGKGKAVKKDWEESTAGNHGTGEWRRRRWIRVVQRICHDEKGSDR